MKPIPIQNPSASKGEFPKTLSMSNYSSSGELHHSLKAMVHAQPFFGLDSENPCNHLHKFEEVCSCLSISGMTQETLRWKLFPYSLMEKTKQWYTHVIVNTNGDWEELKDKFCLSFFPMFHIDSLPRAILDFEQRKKVSIGVA